MPSTNACAFPTSPLGKCQVGVRYSLCTSSSEASLFRCPLVRRSPIVFSQREQTGNRTTFGRREQKAPARPSHHIGHVCSFQQGSGRDKGREGTLLMRGHREVHRQSRSSSAGKSTNRFVFVLFSSSFGLGGNQTVGVSSTSDGYEQASAYWLSQADTRAGS